MESTVVRLHPEDIQAIAAHIFEAITTATSKPEPFLSIDELSEALNIPKPTLYRYTSTSDIPCSKRGRKLKFKRSEVERWLMTRR